MENKMTNLLQDDLKTIEQREKSVKQKISEFVYSYNMEMRKLLEDKNFSVPNNYRDYIYFTLDDEKDFDEQKNVFLPKPKNIRFNENKNIISWSDDISTLGDIETLYSQKFNINIFNTNDFSKLGKNKAKNNFKELLKSNNNNIKDIIFEAEKNKELYSLELSKVHSKITTFVNSYNNKIESLIEDYGIKINKNHPDYKILFNNEHHDIDCEFIFMPRNQKLEYDIENKTLKWREYYLSDWETMKEDYFESKTYHFSFFDNEYLETIANQKAIERFSEILKYFNTIKINKENFMFNQKENQIKEFLKNNNIEIKEYKKNAEHLLLEFKNDNADKKELLLSLYKYLKYSLIKPIHMMAEEDRKKYFFNLEHGNKEKLLTFKDMALYHSLKLKDPDLILNKVKKENTINFSLYYGDIGINFLRDLENFDYFEKHLNNNYKNSKNNQKNGLYNQIFSFYNNGETNE